MAKRISARQRIPWILRVWDKIIFLLIFGAFIFLSPGQNAYFISSDPNALTLPPWPAPIRVPAPYPANMTGVYPGSEVSATGIVVLDLNSGVYMYKRNENVPLSPASTTKLLTALVALDTYQLDDVVTVNNPPLDGQVMGLLPGEQITVENLLYGALIYSGNDAAWALANQYPGGEPKFVDAMNRKAQELHLNDSHFTNPVGYDDPNHYMTPMDLTRLSEAALESETIAKMVAIPEITISDVTHTYFHHLTNVNELLGKIPGVGGIKTGWTEEAGQNLITLVERNGHRVITVVLHSQDRFGDTTKLINWIFANYQWQSLNPTP